MNDAFTAGVEPGGLYSSQEVKILICYMLNSVGEPMPAKAIMDVLFGNGMANFFEISAALEDLQKLNHITETEPDVYRLSDTGKQVASTLYTRVPFTLRERSVKAAMHLLTRIRRERENSVDIKKIDHGREITCTINDTEHPLMSVTLRVADDLQAEMVKDHFLEDPTLLYRSIIAMLTGDAGLKRLDTQIVIDLK